MSGKAHRRRRRWGWQAVAWLVVLVTPFFSSSCLDRSISKRALVSYDVLYTQPEEHGLQYEDIHITKVNGETLHGWWLPREEPVGCIVMLHGNLVNMSFVMDYLELFHAWGYQVFVFDYQGFARSTGEHSIKQLWADTEAAYAYVRSRPDVDPDRILAYGYSLGSPLALELTATHPEIRGVFVEGLIDPGKLMNRYFGGMSKLLLPLMRNWLLPADSDPAESTARLGDRSVMVVQRGDDALADNIAAFLNAAPEHRRFCEFPGASHVTFLVRDDEFRAQMRAFFDDCLQGAQTYATLDAVAENDRDFEAVVRLHGGDWSDGQPAVFTFFNQDKIRAVFHWTLDAGKREYRFQIPRAANGITIDDATARFQIDGDFPGWSLRRREVALEPPRPDITVDARHSTGRKGARPEVPAGLSFRPEAVAFALRRSPAAPCDEQFTLRGKVLVADTNTDVAPQLFYGERWEGSRWRMSTDYCEVIDGRLAIEGEDRATLIREIDKEKGDDWLYALRKLLCRDGLLSPGAAPARLTSSYGLGVVCQPEWNESMSRVLLLGLEVPEEAVQRKVQKSLRRLYPMIDFLPRPRGNTLSPDMLGRLRAWFDANESGLYWDYSAGTYALVADRPDEYNFFDDIGFDYDFNLDADQRNVVTVGYRERYGPERNRREVTLTLDDPVKAQYALLTDQVLDMIEDAFPGSRRELIACAATKLGMVSEEPPTLETLRAWFETCRTRLVWQSKLRMFTLRPVPEGGLDYPQPAENK